MAGVVTGGTTVGWETCGVCVMYVVVTLRVAMVTVV